MDLNPPQLYGKLLEDQDFVLHLTGPQAAWGTLRAPWAPNKQTLRFVPIEFLSFPIA